MKMMLFYIALAAIMFFLLADTTVTLTPFSIKFASLKSAIGWIMVIVGVSLVSLEAGQKAARSATNEVLTNIMNKLDSVTKVHLEKHNLQYEDYQEPKDTGVQKSE